MNHTLSLVKMIILPLVSLAIIDGVLGYFLGYDYSPSSNKIENYFSYGYSTESKLLSIIGESDELARPIAKAGWNDLIPEREPSKASHCELKVTFYGMSFSNRIARQAVGLDPCLSIRLISGPGAPLSHSYWEYKRFAQLDDASILVVGILASSVRKLATVAHFSSAFEAPGSHMYPKYYLGPEGQLNEIAPPATSLHQFRRIIIDSPSTIDHFLSDHDAYYSKWVYDKNHLDNSVIFRMLRRAYGQKRKRSIDARFYNAERGLIRNEGEVIDVAQSIMRSWGDMAASDNKKLIFLLINDKGYDRALESTFNLDELVGQAWLSTSEHIEANNPANFLPDGHFLPKWDQEMARALLSKIYGMEK